MPDLKSKIREDFKLNKDEVNVYLSLLNSGPMNDRELSLITGISISKVKNALEMLLKKNFIAIKIDENGIKKYCALPLYSDLSMQLNTLAKKLDELNTQVNNGLSQSIKFTNSELTNFSEKVNVTFVKQINKSIDSLEQIKDELLAKIEQLRESLQANRERLPDIERLFDENERLIKGLKDELSVVIAESSNKFESITKQNLFKLKSETQNIVKKGLKHDLSLIKKHVSQLSDSLSGFLEEYKNTNISAITLIETTVDDAYEILSRSNSDVKSNIESGTKNLIQELKRFNENINLSASTAMSQVKTLHADYLESLSKHVETTMKKNLDMILKITSSLSRETSTELQRITDDASSIVKSSEQKLIDRISKAKEDTNTTINKLNKYFTNTSKKQNNLIEKTISNLIEITDSTLLNVLETIKTEIPATASSFSEIAESFISKNKTFLSSISDELGTRLDDYFSSILTKKNMISKNIHEIAQTLLNKLTSEIDSSNRELESRVESVFNQLTVNFNDIKNYTKVYIEEYLDKLQSVNDALRKSIVDTIITELHKQLTLTNEIVNRLDETFKTFISVITNIYEDTRYQLSNILNKQIQEINNSYKIWTDGVSDMVNSFISRFSSFMNDMQNSMTTYMGDQVKMVTGVIDKTMTSAISSLDEVISEKTKKVRDIHEQVLNSLNTIINSYDELESKTAEIVDTTISKHMNETTKLTQAINDKLLTHIRSHEYNLTKSYADHVQQLSKLLDEEKSIMEDAINSMVEDADKNLEIDLANLNEELKNIKNNILEKVDNLSVDSVNIIQEFKKSFETIVSQLIEKIEMDLNQKRQEYALQSKDVSKAFNKDLSSLQREVKKNTTKISTYLDTAFAELEQGIHAHTHTLISRLMDTINELTTKWAALPEKYTNNYKIESEKFIESLDALKSDVESEFKQAIEKMEFDLTNYLRDTQHELLGIIDEQMQELYNTVNTSFTSITELIDKKIASSVKHLGEANERSESLVHLLINNLQKTKTSFEKSIMKLESNLNEQIKSTIDAFHDDLISVLQNLNQEIVKPATDILDQIATNIGSQKETTKDAVNDLIKDIEQATEDLPAYLENSLAATISAFNESLNESISEIVNRIKELRKSFDKQINELMKNADGLFSNVITGHESLSNQMNLAWEVFKKSLDEMPHFSWAIYGKNAVISHIISIIEDTSDKITLILPELNASILDILLNLSDDKLIELILASNVKKVEVDRLKKKPGVRIWLSKKAINYYAAVRDDKETFLSIVPENENEIMGIVSLLEENISLMKNIIIPSLIYRVKPI